VASDSAVPSKLQLPGRGDPAAHRRQGLEHEGEVLAATGDPRDRGAPVPGELPLLPLEAGRDQERPLAEAVDVEDPFRVHGRPAAVAEVQPEAGDPRGGAGEVR